MKSLFWKLLAKVLARPAVTGWLIKRAMKAPYSHLEGYMNRYWLFNPYPKSAPDQKKGWCRFFPSVRLHHILREDRDEHMHDHPWDARTIILRGWYEERRPEPLGYASTRRKAGDTASINFGDYHKITQVSSGGVWTLFITYRYRGTWGFLVNGVKVKWRNYLNIPCKQHKFVEVGGVGCSHVVCENCDIELENQ
jgi:hypothetical protein